MDFKMYLAENVLNERRTVRIYSLDDYQAYVLIAISRSLIALWAAL